MKILLVAPVIFPVSSYARYQGIERLVRMWATELHRRGHQVTVAAGTGSTLPRGISLIDAPLGDFVQGELVAYGIYRPLLSGFDIILDFSHSHWAMRQAPLPAVAWCWHSPALMQPPLSGYNMLALSHRQANQLYAYQRVTARVLDCHCGLPRDSSDMGDRYLYIGRLEPNKGALEAVKLCAELGVPLDVVGAVGPGDNPAYASQVVAMCQGDRVYWGELDDSALNHLLHRAKAVLHPLAEGYEEAHSHKCVDCLLAGVPVVSYARGAMDEVVEQGTDGFLARNREEFKHYMGQVDGLDRAEIQRRAMDRWLPENVVGRAMPLLEQVAGGLRWPG